MGFSADIEGFAKRAGLSVNQTVISVALELFGSVIKDTPADTGRARGNWQCSIGSPKSGVLSGDESKSETPAPNGDGPKTAEAIQDVRNVALRLLPDQTIYLSNNLPYIGKLEYGGYGTGPGATEKTGGTGFSIQAPAGMVRKNVARIQQIVAKEAKANKI